MIRSRTIDQVLTEIENDPTKSFLFMRYKGGVDEIYFTVSA